MEGILMTGYTNKSLITTYKAAKRGCNIKTGQWANPILTAENWFQWFQGCLDEKISSTIPGYKKGRKWSRDYETGLWQDRFQLSLHDQVRLITPELRTRLAHRQVGCPLGDR
jgi:hypothetical protein